MPSASTRRHHFGAMLATMDDSADVVLMRKALKPPAPELQDGAITAASYALMARISDVHKADVDDFRLLTRGVADVLWLSRGTS